MKFQVYCDESHPDAFWSRSNSRATFLLIGSLWLPADLRQSIKDDINNLKRVHGFSQEIKWHKVHQGKKEFYEDLVDLFVDRGDQLRFRCIAVEASQVNLVQFHQGDKELGFYKFYYQMLKHWILDFNEYRIFCDEKTNRAADRLNVLRRTLDFSNYSSRVISVQALPSREVVLIQLADFLLGMVSSRLNNAVGPGSFKDQLISYMESRLRIPRISPTPKSEVKFNVFRINLQGGW